MTDKQKHVRQERLNKERPGLFPGLSPTLYKIQYIRFGVDLPLNILQGRQLC